MPVICEEEEEEEEEGQCETPNLLLLLPPPPPSTGVFLDDIGEHEEPVVKCDQLEQGETCSGQVPKPIWVHLSIQATPHNSKHISRQVRQGDTPSLC